MWKVQCDHCKYWQEMTFKDNIKVVDESLIDHTARLAKPGSCMYVCQKCGKDLDSSRWYGNKWVAQRPGKDRPATFFVSQLNAVWIGPEDIYTDYLRSTNEQFFYNYTLGLPFEGSGQSISREDILDNRAEDLPERVTTYAKDKYSYVTMGLDFGQHFHTLTWLGLNSSGKFEVLNIVSVKNSNDGGNIEDDLREIVGHINTTEPDLVYADIGYNGNYIAKLTEIFPNKVFGVNVRSAKSNGDPTIKVNENAHIVTIDKLTQNRILMNDLKAGRVQLWQKDDDELEMFIKHAMNVVIREVQNEKTNEVEQVIGRKGADCLMVPQYSNVL